MTSYRQWMFHRDQLIREGNQLVPNNRPNPMINIAEVPANASVEKRTICNNINIIGNLMTRLYPTGSFNVDAKGTLSGLKYRISYYHLNYILNKEQLRIQLHNIGFHMGKDYRGVLHIYNENRQ